MLARPFFLASSVAAVGSLGWVAFRLYVRSELVRVLNDQYDYGGVLRKVASLEKLVGTRANLPSAEDLAESAVPMWSTIMPEAAMADILANGRKSPYWPKKYLTSDMARVEPYFLEGLRNAGTPGAGPNAVLFGTAAALLRDATASLSKK